MLSHTDIQIARQGALARAIEHYGIEAHSKTPEEIIERARKYEDHLLCPDEINKFVMLFGAVIDFPKPEPTPVSPAAAAPTAVPPPSAPTATSQPPVAPPQENQAPLSVPASTRYAGEKCPWHPDKTRASKHNEDAYYCADRECKWQMRIFQNDGGGEVTKWLASGDSGWLDAADFDARVGAPA